MPIGVAYVAAGTVAHLDVPLLVAVGGGVYLLPLRYAAALPAGLSPSVGFGEGWTPLTHAPSWGAGYKKALIEQANRRLTMVNFISQLPVETNMVDLDPDVKDAWGLPAMRITTTSHENDFKAMQFFIDKSVEILKAAGAHTVWADQVSDSKGGAHARGHGLEVGDHAGHGLEAQLKRVIILFFDQIMA